MMRNWTEVEKNYLIEYHPETRKYYFILHKHHPSGNRVVMYYCPWCGIKLPKELGQEWVDILAKELDIHDLDAEIFAALPKEFRSEEWWQKRGL